ncbi:MAG: DNA-3-methyladenine glycosylase family protein, partial [Dehalococcoidia bacterium]
MADRITRAKLLLTTPLDLATTLFSGQDFRWKQEGDGYVGWLGEAPAFLRIVQGHLEVLSPLPEEEAIAGARRLFRLDDDLQAIQSALAGDPPVARAMGRWPGLRLLRLEPWPTLASFICSARAKIHHITRMVDALSSALGNPVDFLDKRRWRFPSPLALAHAGEARLRTLGLGLRAERLWHTACLVAHGQVDLQGLALLPTEDLRQRLMALPGV